VVTIIPKIVVTVIPKNGRVILKTVLKTSG
jgi:hypothetical protein